MINAIHFIRFITYLEKISSPFQNFHSMYFAQNKFGPSNGQPTYNKDDAMIVNIEDLCHVLY